jgi:glycosyltransferase involved in cell wall biosynthesis
LRSGPALAAIRRLEAFVLRRAERVVAISEPLADSARGFGVRRDRVVLLRNWAPIGSIPDLDRANRWSAEHGLDDRFVFMYAGTLARKHRPDLLLALAREMSSEPDVAVVVVSEGEGADELRRQRAASPDLDRLVVLDYQPFDRLAEVLAAADVLIVLLEPVASSHSVPSKTLSYLCAGRPVLAAVPSENDAVRILVEEAGAGVVVAPDDTEGFVSGAAALRRDPDRCGRLGASGRAYAEREFASDRVVAGFVSAIGLEGIEV